MSRRKSKSKPKTVQIDNPNAAVLDYRQLKITIQSQSNISHRLPSTTEIHKLFSLYGECKVESISISSNQYLITYKKPNSGLNASQCIRTSPTHNTINNVWKIETIKFQWSSYCSSIFYPQTSPLSHCSKGSNCDKIHSILSNDRAFLPEGNKVTDNLKFERFKQLRFTLYQEYNTVQEFDDWSNIEGISNLINDKNKNPKSNPNNTKTQTNDRESDSYTSSSSSSYSSSVGAMTQRPMPKSPLVSNRIPNQNKSESSSHKNQNQNRSLNDSEKRRKAKALLQQKMKNGGGNMKFGTAIAKGQKVRKKRPSPPLQPQSMDNRPKNDEKFMNSSRSTVYNNESGSDSSSLSALNITNNNADMAMDWNKLNEAPSVVSAVSERDTVAMRYLNGNKGTHQRRNVSISPKKASPNSKARKSVRKRKAQSPPTTPPPQSSENEAMNGKAMDSPQSSITSAEKTALRTVRSVLGPNEVNLSRVPIIDPNANTVSYVQNDGSVVTKPNINEIPQPKPPKKAAFINKVTRAAPPSMPPSNSVHNYNLNMPYPNVFNSMPNSMPNPMIMPVISAPPYYPSIPTFHSIPNQPIIPFAGNILAGGTFAPPPQMSQPQMRNKMPPSIPTTAVMSQPQMSQPQMSQPQMSRPQMSQPQMSQPQMSQPQIRNKMHRNKRSNVRHQRNGKQFEFKHNTDRQCPQSLEDYHWLCYHFRSGQPYSCKEGKNCKWRHYDFETRTDIITKWDPNNSNPKFAPNVHQLAEARILKRSIEQKYKYLRDKKYSNNVFIKGNDTPPDVKRSRVRVRNKERKVVTEDEEKQTEMKDKCVESDSDNDNNNECEETNVVRNGNGNGNGKRELLNKVDTLRSIMAPFANSGKEKQDGVDYYIIGQITYQQLDRLREFIANDM